MLSFTRKTDYALLALGTLAEAHDPARPARISARQIAERYRVSHPLLMNALKDLLRAGLVNSTRGVKGGYSVARDPHSITVQDVVVATEGHPALVACCDPESGPDHDCAVTLHCPITHTVRRLNDRILGFLGEITLADLVDNPRSAAPPTEQFVPLSILRSSGKGER